MLSHLPPLLPLIVPSFLQRTSVETCCVSDIRAQVLATDKSAGAEIDFKYAHLGTLLGVAISVGFPALKICMIWKHLSDQDSAGQRNTVPGFTEMPR